MTVMDPPHAHRRDLSAEDLAASARLSPNGWQSIRISMVALACLTPNAMPMVPVPAAPVKVEQPNWQFAAYSTEQAPTWSAADAIRELHRESGLTWDQLSKLFGTSRRALHMWANGARLSATNESRLHELESIIRALRSSSNPDDRRAALMARDPATGLSRFDQLRAQFATSTTNSVGAEPLLPAVFGANAGEPEA